MGENNVSEMFSSLVEDDKDVVGLFAYSLYRFKKMKYIEQYLERYNVNSIPEDKLNSFSEGALVQKEDYRKSSIDLLKEYSSILIVKSLDGIMCPKASKFPWGKSIFASTIGGFVLGLIIALVLFSVGDSELKSILNKFF